MKNLLKLTAETIGFLVFLALIGFHVELLRCVVAS